MKLFSPILPLSSDTATIEKLERPASDFIDLARLSNMLRTENFPQRQPYSGIRGSMELPIVEGTIQIPDPLAANHVCNNTPTPIFQHISQNAKNVQTQHNSQDVTNVRTHSVSAEELEAVMCSFPKNKIKALSSETCESRVEESRTRNRIHSRKTR